MRVCDSVFVACLLAGFAACKADGGDDSAGATTSGSTTAADSSGDSGSSTTGSICDAIVDCLSCWQCARSGACNDVYIDCAANPDCVGSLACVDSMCAPDGVTQDCVTFCCQNCAEHFTCPTVDIALMCMEEQCAQYCGAALCA